MPRTSAPLHTMLRSDGVAQKMTSITSVPMTPQDATLTRASTVVPRSSNPVKQRPPNASVAGSVQKIQEAKKRQRVTVVAAKKATATAGTKTLTSVAKRIAAYLFREPQDVAHAAHVLSETPPVVSCSPVDSFDISLSQRRAKRYVAYFGTHLTSSFSQLLDPYPSMKRHLLRFGAEPLVAEEIGEERHHDSGK